MRLVLARAHFGLRVRKITCACANQFLYKRTVISFFVQSNIKCYLPVFVYRPFYFVIEIGRGKFSLPSFHC